MPYPLTSRRPICWQVREDGDVGPLAQSKQGSQYRSLRFCLIRHSERVAEGVGNRQCPRGSNFARHLGQHGGGAYDPADEHNLRTNTTALTLRDLEGPESEQLCNVLDVCETG